MGYQPLEQLLPRANYSIYKLVMMASQRATELADGKPQLIDFPSSPKTTTIALDEIVEGKVELKEAAEAKEKTSQQEEKIAFEDSISIKGLSTRK